MACPDELTLELWLAGVLPSDEATSIVSHVPSCATCSLAVSEIRGFSAELHGALALGAQELAYLTALELPAAWSTRSASADMSWSWIALASVVAGFVAWLIAAPMVGSAVAVAAQIGVGTVLLNAVFGLMFGIGQTLFDLIRNPALGLSQPLLALLALALLLWPRLLIPQRSTHS
jgi:hypothetical protein